MPRRASYIPLSHDDYSFRAFRQVVWPYGDRCLNKPGALDRVKEMLLHTNANLVIIARQIGYRSSTTLSQAFKRQTGMTIKEWLAAQKQHGASTKPEADQ
jgi:hypothetical protein